jgi:hypothetical protein
MVLPLDGSMQQLINKKMKDWSYFSMSSIFNYFNYSYLSKLPGEFCPFFIQEIYVLTLSHLLSLEQW